MNTLTLKKPRVYLPPMPSATMHKGARVTPPRRDIPAHAREFWFIWASGPAADFEYVPKRRHETLASAQVEAQRLSRKNPAKRFHVYHAAAVQP